MAGRLELKVETLAGDGRVTAGGRSGGGGLFVVIVPVISVQLLN
jgi:hypothetical protein